ncbi:hypothetical protein NLG97_g6255 [Lecanicillium saksenae]|uniref:Uncharacterized protein n=1 Tax=Lecanicillium saksenae TaxID=468837 RepID=A0ACC1QRH8_9HYPO|nr:hypothetical protein NLG97_g6255 [Lecanicillium saksenae]
MPDPNDYAVGWICAIQVEYVAAQELLDEEHDSLDFVFPSDRNEYTRGRIGRHNVVIAVLPDGEYGTASASSVATSMLDTFPNIKIGLMVGVGGGAPSSRHDIRLGDVVVSTPGQGMGGVFQYDFGKTIQGQSFQHTRLLNQPPTVLLTAIAGIRAQYARKGHRLTATIDEILQRNPRLRRDYKKPDSVTDKLFKSEIIHDVRGCGFCANDPNNLIARPERTEEEDNPAIHYGLIASANQLMKDAIVRDSLTTEKDVLCFEMEAGGLMNAFPCVVIRGICDYSDSHKAKEWQGYAAMTAAAFTKDLLNRIPPNRIESEKRILDVVSDLQAVAQVTLERTTEVRDIAKKHLEAEENFSKERLLEKQEKCHQLFRLAEGTDANYEWYKDRVADRVEDTCIWVLDHPHFQSWLKQDFGPLLVTADPGCGKSVLAKYLVDDGLPREAAICYFFFKDQDQNTPQKALCAILHQLFLQRPTLIKYAMEQYRTDGDAMIRSTQSLWSVMLASVNDPDAGSVIIVLDALDECKDVELTRFLRDIERQFLKTQTKYFKLKYFLTCRPYGQLVSKFYTLLENFQNIRIPGEEESEAISREIDLVIRHRVKQLPHLTPKIREYLEQMLKGNSNRTYLWVHLVFEHLDTEGFMMTLAGVDAAIATLPKSVNEAYEQILQRSKDQPMVRKALCIILAAKRPLTVAEMNIAVNTDPSQRSIHDFDLEDHDHFKSRLRSWCGLFVSIYQGRIYFLHQTARDFLLADATKPSNATQHLQWHGSVTSQESHRVLAKICVIFLSMCSPTAILWRERSLNAAFSITALIIRVTSRLQGFDKEAASFDGLGGTLANTSNDLMNHMDDFFYYSATAWGEHFRNANFEDNDPIMSVAVGICDGNSDSYQTWFPVTERSIFQRQQDYPSQAGNPGIADFAGLMVASYLGLTPVIKHLLDMGADIERRDQNGQTPLWWAASKGHENAVILLLSRKAETQARSYYGLNPILAAGVAEQAAVVRLLLERRTALELSKLPTLEELKPLHPNERSKYRVKFRYHHNENYTSVDEFGRTAMRVSAEASFRDTVVQLVRAGANVQDLDLERGTSLIHSAADGNEVFVKLALDAGASVTAADGFGRTPLLMAATHGHDSIFKLLLDKGSDALSRDANGDTPLSHAARRGNLDMVRCLLDRGADGLAKDASGRTPLSQAATYGQETIVQMLLEARCGTKPELVNDPTIMAGAARDGYESIVRILLENGAAYDGRGAYGLTPLSHAAERGHAGIVKLLMDRGANTEATNDEGATPMIMAAAAGYRTVVQLLIDGRANIEATTCYGQTALIAAASKGESPVVQLLLTNHANTEARDTTGGTALLEASIEGHPTVVGMLIEAGADVNVDDANGHSALWWATYLGKGDLIELLLENGAKELDDAQKGPCRFPSPPPAPRPQPPPFPSPSSSIQPSYVTDDYIPKGNYAIYDFAANW